MSLLEFCDIDGEIGPSEEKEFNISLPDLQAHLCCYRRQHISDMMDEFKQNHDMNDSWNKDQYELLNMAHHVLEGDWETVLKTDVATYLLGERKNDEPIFVTKNGMNGLILFLQNRIHHYINYADTKNEEIYKYYEVLFVAICLANMYVQGNYTGPQLEETMNIHDYYPFKFMNLDSENAKEYRKNSLTFLELDGEIPYSLIKYPLLLAMARAILTILSSCENIYESMPTLYWWSARVGVLHNRALLDKPVYTLHELLDVAFNKTIEYCLQHSDVYSQVRVYIERALAYLYSQETEKAYKYIDKATEISNLHCYMTGVEGRRTKFQTFDTSQLFLFAKSNLQNEEVSTHSTVHAGLTNQEIEEQEKTIQKKQGSIQEEKEVTKTNSTSMPQTVLLDELDQDNILLEHIKIKEDTDEELKNQQELCILDQILLISKCIDIHNNNPKFGLITEQMAPYINRTLMHASNWSVYSTSLLYKTYIDYENNRTKERSIIQLQVLVDQLTNETSPFLHDRKQIADSAPIWERLMFIYQLGYPPSWEMERQLAKRYMNMGMCRSALQIFEKLELYEDQIDCLNLLNEIPQAVKIVENLLQQQPTPFLWCRLAELQDNVAYFESSWELSNHHYARAQRGLGKHYFYYKEYEECIKHYELALNINQLYPDIWFNKGTAHMILEDMNMASLCFSRVVQMQPDNGQAWCNLAGILYNQKKYQEAFQSITIASQYLDDRWKVWDNMITISMKTKNYNSVMNAFHRYIDLQQKKDLVIDYNLLNTLTLKVLQKAKLIEGEETDLQEEEKEEKEEEIDIQQETFENVKELLEEVPMEDYKEDSEEKLEQQKKEAEEHNNAFTVKKLGELLGRIQTLFPKEPKIYDTSIIYYLGTNQSEKVQSALLKKTRAFMVGTWYNDEKSVVNVLDSCYELLKNTMENKITASEFEVKMMCNSCLKRCETTYSSLESFTKLSNYVNSLNEKQ